MTKSANCVEERLNSRPHVALTYGPGGATQVTVDGVRFVPAAEVEAMREARDTAAAVAAAWERSARDAQAWGDAHERLWRDAEQDADRQRWFADYWRRQAIDGWHRLIAERRARDRARAWARRWKAKARQEREWHDTWMDEALRWLGRSAVREHQRDRWRAVAARLWRELRPHLDDEAASRERMRARV